MPVNPKFLAARAAERQHRDLAHLHALCWLPLHRRGVRLTRCPLVPLTERHKLELRAAGNAFFAPARPALLGDVFLFLWRLHPLYRAPRPTCAGRTGGFLFLWFALGSFPAAFIFRRLRRFVRQSDLGTAVSALREFIEVAEQDAPGDAADASGRPVHRSLAAPERQAADNHVQWLMATYSLSHDDALDTPIALRNQLYRERLFNEPDADARICARSDGLLSA